MKLGDIEDCGECPLKDEGALSWWLDFWGWWDSY